MEERGLISVRELQINLFAMKFHKNFNIFSALVGGLPPRGIRADAIKSIHFKRGLVPREGIRYTPYPPDLSLILGIFDARKVNMNIAVGLRSIDQPMI